MACQEVEIMKIAKILTFILIIIIIASSVVYFKFFRSNVVDAQLHIESPEVKVNNIPVSGNIKLKENDIIETTNGLATIILHESILIALDKNTKVSLSDLKNKHPKVFQESGSTWNKFIRISGVEDYTLTTSNTVASIRGTAFGLIEGNILGDWKCLVGENEIDYNIDSQDFIIEKNYVVDKVLEKIEKRPATPEELEYINGRNKRIVSELKYLRQLKIDKLPNKVKYGLTDQEIQQKLEEADQGNINVDEVMSKFPVNLPLLNEIAEITKEIQSLNQELNDKEY